MFLGSSQILLVEFFRFECNRQSGQIEVFVFLLSLFPLYRGFHDFVSISSVQGSIGFVLFIGRFDVFSSFFLLGLQFLQLCESLESAPVLPSGVFNDSGLLNLFFIHRRLGFFARFPSRSSAPYSGCWGFCWFIGWSVPTSNGVSVLTPSVPFLVLQRFFSRCSHRFAVKLRCSRDILHTLSPSPKEGASTRLSVVIFLLLSSKCLDIRRFFRCYTFSIVQRILCNR